MSKKKDDASKTLKKKLKKLKKLEAEIVALKAKAADRPKTAKPAKGKAKAGKKKAVKKSDGKVKAGTAVKSAAPSLVRSEPVKPIGKEAAAPAAVPSARVATG